MTRAVLLASSGAVHRVIVGPDGADQAKCGQRYQNASLVSPAQARVYGLSPCGGCWREREHQWQHFVEGVTL